MYTHALIFPYLKGMKRVPVMAHIFGPVPSRRLGLSLGVDLIPPKTCTYDCLYCEVGRTTCHIVNDEPFVSALEIADELEIALSKSRPDTITLAGSGEPTLNSEIEKIIASIRKQTDINTALLTNGSLFWKEEVLQRVMGVDIILPTLTTVFEETFRAIHRPCAELNVSKLISGLKDLRRRYKGLIFLEVVLLSGVNDKESELEGLKGIISEISPDKVQLNTVIRPPSYSRAMPVQMERMEQIKNFLGEKAEIIAYPPSQKRCTENDSADVSIVEMAKRRPVRLTDIATALHMTLEESEGLVKELVIKGLVSKREHGGEIFYISK
jgi:wyosine [tRNA(Phe)-imidazoG37] synthetase (radical SAM superfamily)